MSEDKELVVRAQSGDRPSLEALFRRHQDDVYRFAMSLMWSNEAQARDLAQDTFLTAFQNLGSFQGASSFRTWLLGIAFNLYRNHLRKLRAERKYSVSTRTLTLDPRGTEEIVEANQEHELLKVAFSKIAQGQREAVYLRDILGCSYEETAKVLRISQDAVKNRIHVGRENIKIAMRELVEPQSGKGKQDG